MFFSRERYSKHKPVLPTCGCGQLGVGLLFDSSSCCELCVMFSCVPGIDSLMAPKLERFLFWDRRTDGQEFLWNSGEALLRSTQFKFGFSFSQCYDGCEKLKTKLGFGCRLKASCRLLKCLLEKACARLFAIFGL